MIGFRAWLRPRAPRSGFGLTMARREVSFTKDQRHLTPEEDQKRRVNEALWQAFPEARSEAHLAALAAPHFRRPNGKSLSPRTVKYWLRGDCLPDYMNAHTLRGMVGNDHFDRKGGR